MLTGRPSDPTPSARDRKSAGDKAQRLRAKIPYRLQRDSERQRERWLEREKRDTDKSIERDGGTGPEEPTDGQIDKDRKERLLDRRGEGEVEREADGQIERWRNRWRETDEQTGRNGRGHLKSRDGFGVYYSLVSVI